MQVYLFIFLISFPFLLLGNSPQPKSLSALSTQLEGQTFRGILIPGFHFNYKAPNQIHFDTQKIKPILKNPTRIEFRVPKKTWKKASAELYVCDDEVTYCETLTVELMTAKPAKLVSNATVKIENLEIPTESKISQISKPLKKNKFGFIEGDFKQSLEKAKKENKPLLVDFSAVWCPGCLRLEQEIFPKKEFRAWTKNYILSHVDVDQFENQELAKRYGIKGVPTLLILNGEGEEIQRIYDFQPIPVLNHFFRMAEQLPLSLDKLKAQVESEKNISDEQLNLLGDRLFFSSRTAEALVVYEKAKVPSPRFWETRISEAEASKDQGRLRKTLEAALAAEAETSRSITWREKLLPLLEKDQKLLLEQGLNLASKLLADESMLKKAVETEVVGEFTGYEKLMVAIQKASLHATYLTKIEKKNPDDEVVRAVWKSAADATRLSFKETSSLGPSLRYFLVLMSAANYSEAELFIDQLIRRYPQSLDLHRRKLRVLVQLKKYPEAIVIGRNALKNAFGRNEFWVAEFLAKAYIGANQKNEADLLLKKYLVRDELKAENMKSTKESLEKIAQELNQKKSA